MMSCRLVIRQIVILVAAVCMTATAQETCPPLTDGLAPRTFEELWAGIDPSKEPLDVEVLREWEQDGIVMKIVRYRIGIFKGEKAMMAAVYGYPKGGENLPGLVHIHGGGQFANHIPVLEHAKRGYAVISIAWAGRIYAPGYRVGRNVVELFWSGQTNDANYKVTTDWGGVDGYHAPCRYEGNNFSLNPPSENALDPVPSPRNSGWFLATIGARRALTFLEQQPEVDGNKLGVFGHSMGGKLTVMTAATDSRVVAAPSCGGVSDRYKQQKAYTGLLSDEVYLSRVRCPIVFLNPANDFHANINDLVSATEELSTDEWRLTCAPHRNHNSPPSSSRVSGLWFDQHLKGTFTMPATPATELQLKTDNGIPLLNITPEVSTSLQKVEVYYTQHGRMDGKRDSIDNIIARFWNYAPAIRKGDVWTASLPLGSTARPLWVYANVTYANEGSSEAPFTLSSLVHLVSTNELVTAGVQATREWSKMIETFDEGWEKEWFTYQPKKWGRSTYKAYKELAQVTENSALAMGVLSEQANTLVMMVDDSGAEVDLKGGDAWQEVILRPSDFINPDGTVRESWKGLKKLQLTETKHLRPRGGGETIVLGAEWKGSPPQFRNLRWSEGGE